MATLYILRTVINYLHGVNIDNNLDFIRTNYGNASFIRFINALHFYQQMFDEYPVMGQNNLFLNVYLILLIYDSFYNSEDINDVDGGDVNSDVIDTMHRFSFNNTNELIQQFNTDFGINLPIEEVMLSDNFQTEERPAPIRQDLNLPFLPNLIVDYDTYYGVPDEDDSDEDEDEDEDNEDNEDDEWEEYEPTEVVFDTLPNPVPLVINDNLVFNRNAIDEVCAICQYDDRHPVGDNSLQSGFCRVNCPRGHVFHCWCINNWRNTHKTHNTYQNNCPVCRAPITSMINFQFPRSSVRAKARISSKTMSRAKKGLDKGKEKARLKANKKARLKAMAKARTEISGTAEFGKSKNKLKSKLKKINSEIKYLNK